MTTKKIEEKTLKLMRDLMKDLHCREIGCTNTEEKLLRELTKAILEIRRRLNK